MQNSHPPIWILRCFSDKRKPQDVLNDPEMILRQSEEGLVERIVECLGPLDAARPIFWSQDSTMQATVVAGRT